ncbi:hybrid sensor histidine kinase/response regulator [Pseudomonas phoenicis]|uniref:hybrid sensor histidine kinase/response regulator n=1 Tax=unclassified Pseudomonas TaxID=196821 RepID=UPI0039A3C319
MTAHHPSPPIACDSEQRLHAEVLRLRGLLEAAGIEPDPTGPTTDAAIAEQARRARTAARHWAVFESAVDFAIVLSDHHGLVTDWNTGATHIMGWSAEQMCGESIERFFTDEDCAIGRPFEEMRLALRDGRVSDERWHVRQDGTRFWASGELMPLHGERGEHLGFMKILRDRTHEHLAGRSIVEAQERHRLVAKATNDAIWDWDMASGQVQWNDALNEAYGHSLDHGQMGYQWWVAHIHPEDRDRVYTSIRAVIDGVGTTWSDGYRFQRADGSYAEVLDRGYVSRDLDGHAVRMIGAMLDLTRMRSAEAALRKSEERFRTMLEIIETAFAIVEVKFDEDDQPIDYRFLEVNPAFERQSGVNLQGKWVTEYAPDLEPFWFQTYGHVAKTGESTQFENYAESFSRWFDVRAVRVGDPEERQIGIFFNDVTERRNAEDRLRVSEQLARENVERVQLALAAGAIIGTWHWDLVHDRFTVDEAFATSFGLDPALGRVGLSLEQVVATVHPEDRNGLIAAIDEACQRGGAYAHQYRVKRVDGNYYWIEANGRVDHAADGTPMDFPGVLIDVGERRAVREQRDHALNALRHLTETLEQRVAERTLELVQSEEKLRQSQKMEAVGQLTGGLAHDFNNLLAGISGSLELMKLRLSQNRLNDIDKYMTAAQGAAKRAAGLTHRLLAFSRRQTLDPQPIDVVKLIEGLSDLIQRSVGPSIVIETFSVGGKWRARADASQLENALLNLCINARDAMPEGGRIIIETANRWIGVDAAKLLDVPTGQYLSLSVTDTGTGMPPEVLAKAFDPFFTTKPIGQGTGLGLSMIYGFAKQSGGQARIFSELGKGTTVTIYLPRAQGDTVEQRSEPSATSALRNQAGKTVLIVDDEPTVRLLLDDVLNDLGYTVIDAADSVAGLTVLRSNTAIDLLVTDVGLPGGLNGRQLADAGRVLRPHLKTLFITGYAESAAIGNGQLEPGMLILTKPFAVEALVARVRELMEM